MGIFVAMRILVTPPLWWALTKTPKLFLTQNCTSLSVISARPPCYRQIALTLSWRGPPCLKQKMNFSFTSRTLWLVCAPAVCSCFLSLLFHPLFRRTVIANLLSAFPHVTGVKRALPPAIPLSAFVIARLLSHFPQQPVSSLRSASQHRGWGKAFAVRLCDKLGQYRGHGRIKGGVPFSSERE